MHAERFFGQGDGGEALLARLLDARQGGELADGRRQPADRRLGGIVIERTREVFQRCNQTVQHVQHGEQHDAAVQEPLFNAGTGPFETGNQFSLSRLPLDADCVRCS